MEIERLTRAWSIAAVELAAVQSQLVGLLERERLARAAIKEALARDEHKHAGRRWRAKARRQQVA